MSIAVVDYLLDTNVLIWLDREPERVPGEVVAILSRSSSVLWVSSVSFWELAIKQGLGNIDASLRLDTVVTGYALRELTVTSKYADTVRQLPPLHRDPFDRMLVAQAKVEGMVLVTSDRRLSGYPIATLQV